MSDGVVRSQVVGTESETSPKDVLTDMKKTYIHVIFLETLLGLSVSVLHELV